MGVSEFLPEHSRWMQFPLVRGFRDNLALVRWNFRDKRVRLSAVILQPRMPYWRMRLIGLLAFPWKFFSFNDDFWPLLLRARTLGASFRAWILGNPHFFVWAVSAGGVASTAVLRTVAP